MKKSELSLALAVLFTLIDCLTSLEHLIGLSFQSGLLVFMIMFAAYYIITYSVLVGIEFVVNSVKNKLNKRLDINEK